jgi:hypothetical protein
MTLTLSDRAVAQAALRRFSNEELTWVHELRNWMCDARNLSLVRVCSKKAVFALCEAGRDTSSFNAWRAALKRDQFGAMRKVIALTPNSTRCSMKRSHNLGKKDKTPHGNHFAHAVMKHINRWR